ncbi:hydroxymethylglutaryl-CoA lyase [Desulfosarcina widdelii]|uniref:Hydroxymethylglutaryl-CoA lyase n=1 Tax=Desulfosarcina widdelii TaxID=947919 RepID=A0A5K7ZFQ5_9BACT|nr:hydroxymethylglutaryl-CoA lyase [Desulfosarcina widdelii]BBO78631.1 hydroxymethylglutaryl-CoA lyase [Desulfosarcina widdelii]
MNGEKPKTVTLVEVGPRDGFQFEKTVVPTERKLDVIARLAAAGLRRIQVTSFVHPAKVPQMADAETLVARLPKEGPVAYSALVLNERGLARALACGIANVEISLSASDAHSRKNAGMPHAEALTRGLTMIDRAVSAGVHVRASIQCAFGCVEEGAIPAERIAETIRRFIDHGAHELSLADTTGMGSPPAIRNILDTVRPLSGGLPLALHLHDTRGLGLVNLMAAMDCGVAIFDTSLAGMGGCPFVSGAAGNIATEDTAYLLSSLGIDTGVDVDRVGAISRELETFFNTTFSGRIHRLSAHFPL